MRVGEKEKKNDAVKERGGERRRMMQEERMGEGE